MLGSKPLYEEKLRVPPGVSLGTDLDFYSSLVWRTRDKDASNDHAHSLIILIITKKYDSEMSSSRRESLKALYSRKPLYLM